MKKAVIATGGKQYLVSEGDEIEVELLKAEKSVDFDALLIIDGNKTVIGNPVIKDVKVSAKITENNVKADKVLAIRYKAKKRVHKVQGHRQQHTRITISKIA